MNIGSFAGGMADGIKTGAYLRTLQDERETNKIDREFKQEKIREQREASEIIKSLQRDLLGERATGAVADSSVSNPVRSGVTAAPREGSAPASGTSAPTGGASGGSGATDSGGVSGLPGVETGGASRTTPATSSRASATGETSLSDRFSKFSPAIQAAAQRHGVPMEALSGVLAQESSFNPQAVGDGGNSWGMGQFNRKGAAADFGLTQEQILAMPAEQQIDYVAKFLRQKIDQENGDVWGGVKRYNGGGDPNYVQNVRQRITELGGLTRVNTKPVPTLSAEQYADIYQRYTLLAASNPTAAERLKPTLEIVRNLGLSRYMEQYEGDRGSLDYMRYYGQGQALFGQPMDPTLLFNAERMTKADERADRAEQRAERADQRAEEMQQWTMERTTQADLRAEETHKATMDEHELNRRLKEAEVTLKQYDPLYKLIRGDQFEAAQRLAAGMGFKISGFEDGTVRLPDGTEVPTTYYWRTTEDGQQVRENTAEQARRLGFIETNLEKLKLQTVKSNEYNKPDTLVGVTVGADGQPVAREIPVQPAAGSDRETVATGIGAAAETPAPKASEGNWFTRMFKSDEPESAPTADGGKEAPAESEPETGNPGAVAPEAPAIKDAPTFADPKRGVMQEQDGKAVLVYPNGMKLGTGGRKTHVVINGEVVPMQQEAEGP